MESPRYRLIRTIASGGMAHVYEAVSTGERGFERRVAIKRVLPELAHDDSMRRMFFDEARIASQLHHGSIVQVLDYGLVDGSEFIVMEYVDGLDARRASRTGRKRESELSEALALHITAEVAHALAYAHERRGPDGNPLGIVHRDVSPQNILLGWDGDVKLSDFGIASSFEKEERTATGVIKGKLSYMPPEQFSGSRVDGSADVYALGASLHAMLAGSAPMSDAAALPGRFAGSPLELSDELSPEVGELIRRCMAHDRIERPTAEELAAEAGGLATLRLPRDARGALREWMSSLRPPPTKRGRLDDLTGLCLLMTDDRQFTVSREETVRGRAERAPEDAPTTLSDASTTIRRRRPWAIPAVAVVALALGGWGLATFRDATPSVELPVASDAGTAMSPTDVRPAFPSPDVNAEPSDPDVAAVGGGEHVPEERLEEDVPRMVVAMRTRMREPMRTEMELEMAPSAAAGWIRVAHPRGAGVERVFVDGRAVGYTPNLFRVPLGRHAIEVRSLDSGDVVTATSVDVRAHHVRSAPSVVRR